MAKFTRPTFPVFIPYTIIYRNSSGSRKDFKLFTRFITYGFTVDGVNFSSFVLPWSLGSCLKKRPSIIIKCTDTFCLPGVLHTNLVHFQGLRADTSRDLANYLESINMVYSIEKEHKAFFEVDTQGIQVLNILSSNHRYVITTFIYLFFVSYEHRY